MKSPRLFALLALSLLPACVSLETAAPPVATFATAGRGNYAQLCQGRDLYIGACTKCHSAEPIKKFSLTEWQSDILPRMFKKSKMSGGDAAAVASYVQAVSQAPTAPVKP